MCECGCYQEGASIILEVDYIDFHTNKSPHWFIGLLWMQAHKPIHKPPSTNISRASWLIGVCHVCLPGYKHTHMLTYMAHSSSSRSRAAGRQRLLSDSLIEVTLSSHCTRVDLSPDVARQQHIRATLNQTPNEFQWKNLTICVCMWTINWWL